MSTTISCRFFAQATALMLVLGTAAMAAAQPPLQPVPQLPSPPLQPVPQLPPPLQPVPQLPSPPLQPVPQLPPPLQPVPQLPPPQPQPFPQPPTSKPASQPRPRGDQPRAPQLVPGAERWSVALASTTTVPPVIHDRQVLAVVPPASIASFRLEDGAELWRVELTANHPLGVHDGRVFVAAGEALHALDAKTGAIVWRQPTGVLTAPPLVHEGWIVTASGGEVVASRASDGTVVWRQPHGALQHRPTIEGDRLLLPLAEPRILAVDLTTGAERWTLKLGGAPSEIAALDGRIYVGSADKYFYCFDADDGNREWRHRVGAVVVGRAAVDTERVYVATTDNLLRAYDRVNGAIKWQAPLPFRPSAGPLVFGTAVIVPGAVAEVPTFDVSTGKKGRAMTLSAPLAGQPDVQATDRGPLAATVTASLSGDWKLSLWETPMSIPTAALSVLPGKPVPLPAAPPPGSAAR